MRKTLFNIMDEIDNDKKLTDKKKYKMLLKLVDKVRTVDEISYLVDLLNTYRWKEIKRKWKESIT